MLGKQIVTESLLENLMPKYHLLIKLDEIINFSFIRRMTASLYCKNFGRPSIDPLTVFRMQLVGYVFGIFSDRQLCKEIQLYIAYRWFCRFKLTDKIPLLSSLSRIRDRLGVDTYKRIFDVLLRQWHKEGLLGGNTFYTEATIISANA